MSRKKYDAATTLAGCLLFVVLVPAGLALSSWIFMFMWNYVLVWVFPTLPILDFWRSMGCVLFLWFVSNFFKK